MQVCPASRGGGWFTSCPMPARSQPPQVPAGQGWRQLSHHGCKGGRHDQGLLTAGMQRFFSRAGGVLLAAHDLVGTSPATHSTGCWLGPTVYAARPTGMSARLLFSRDPVVLNQHCHVKKVSRRAG